jgi:hypothetical protein
MRSNNNQDATQHKSKIMNDDVNEQCVGPFETA